MILVTGASGNNGCELIKLLSNAKVTVRGMIRRPRGLTMAPLPGAEFVTADFDDPESLRRALDGVEQVFLVTPSSERVEAQQLSFVETGAPPGSATSSIFRSFMRPGIRRFAFCAITRSWKMPSPRRG